mmetsp:Transcript_17459/g.66039  ORF Transcript_17459/g.66039 Transcript_17459/m.66039 type:complete len:206 (-) Transcript_17459:539-1156(-)
MALLVALRRPSGPSMRMYIQLMGRMRAEPKGEALTAPARLATMLEPVPPVGEIWCPGKNGARCSATPMDPTPGPPPPCGMQKVLCRFRWQTSAPIRPGEVRPTCAFMFAPSMYTWPPRSWMASHMSMIPPSNTPNVEGYVTMNAARLSLCFSALATRSSKSMSPPGLVSTVTTFMPAMTAEAGLVPWADLGMRQMLRWPSSLLRW